MMTEKINRFCELTGANREEAQNYLQLSNWMLEQAVDEYFMIEDERHPQPQMFKIKEIENDDVKKRIWAPNKQGTSTSTASAKNLDSLFSPPFSLMYEGSFDQAREAAKLQKKWLMVNVQSEDVFHSFMLNRDTWSDESVQDAIGARFIFWQIYNHKYGSKKVCMYYQVSSFPTVLIIDPITGQQMHTWTGFIEPSKLMNVLLHYSLNNPNDCLQAISHKALKESASKPTEADDDSDEDEEDLEDYADDYGGDSTEEYSEEDVPDYDMNEDIGDDNEAEENVVEDIDEDGEPLENMADDYYEENREEDNNEEIYQSNSEEKKLAYLPLPEEPVVSKELLCRTGVRFPDGRRLQRNFLRTDSVKLLWSLCLSKMEGREMSTPFYFMHSIPGTPSKSVVFGSDLTFEEAGLCNALVVLVWL